MRLNDWTLAYMLDSRQHVLIAAGMTLTDFALPN